jgi:hypothetical protein
LYVSGEASKQLGDYKFKLQKAEQDISTLQANVSLLNIIHLLVNFVSTDVELYAIEGIQ